MLPTTATGLVSLFDSQQENYLFLYLLNGTLVEDTAACYSSHCSLTHIYANPPPISFLEGGDGITILCLSSQDKKIADIFLDGF